MCFAQKSLYDIQCCQHFNFRVGPVIVDSLWFEIYRLAQPQTSERSKIFHWWTVTLFLYIARGMYMVSLTEQDEYHFENTIIMFVLASLCLSWSKYLSALQRMFLLSTLSSLIVRNILKFAAFVEADRLCKFHSWRSSQIHIKIICQRTWNRRTCSRKSGLFFKN